MTLGFGSACCFFSLTVFTGPLGNKPDSDSDNKQLSVSSLENLISDRFAESL